MKISAELLEEKINLLEVSKLYFLGIYINWNPYQTLNMETLVSTTLNTQNSTTSYPTNLY